jgi:tetratricopeptide (TPR) repeat protein
MDAEPRQYSPIFTGEVYHAQKEVPKALDYYRQALELRRSIGDQRGLSTTLHNTGVLYNDIEEYFQGLDYLEQALAIRKTISWLSAERLTLLAMSVSYYYLQEWRECERIMSQVVELSRRLNDPELELDLSQLEQVRELHRETGG